MHGGGEEAPAGCRCGMRSGGRCLGQLQLPEECIEVRGRRCTSTSFTLFLPLQWLGGAVAGWTVVAAAGTVHRPPRLLEVGQEAEFYMVHDDPPSTRGGGGGGGRLAVRIVRPLPWGLVVFKRAMAAGATGVAEECPSGVGGRRGAGGGQHAQCSATASELPGGHRCHGVHACKSTQTKHTNQGRTA